MSCRSRWNGKKGLPQPLAGLRDCTANRGSRIVRYQLTRKTNWQRTGRSARNRKKFGACSDGRGIAGRISVKVVRRDWTSLSYTSPANASAGYVPRCYTHVRFPPGTQCGSEAAALSQPKGKRSAALGHRSPGGYRAPQGRLYVSPHAANEKQRVWFPRPKQDDVGSRPPMIAAAADGSCGTPSAYGVVTCDGDLSIGSGWVALA